MGDKNTVRLATTVNHALTGLADIDGVTPAADDRILVRANTAGATNGIYVASASAWSRARDMDETNADRITAGLKVFVQEGSTDPFRIVTGRSRRKTVFPLPRVTGLVAEFALRGL